MCDGRRLLGAPDACLVPTQLTKPYAEEERPYLCVETDEASACMVCLDCEGQAREYNNLVKVRAPG